MKRFGILLGMGFLSSVTAAHAFDENLNVPSKTDRADVAVCLAKAADEGAESGRCVGVVSGRCLADPENGSNVAIGGCYDREATIWDDLLNADYGKLMAGLDAARKADLRKMQKSWIGLKEETCALEASFYDGGTGAGPASVACYMRMTAYRALILHGLTAYLDQ